SARSASLFPSCCIRLRWSVLHGCSLQKASSVSLSQSFSVTVLPPDYLYLGDHLPDISSDKFPGSGCTGQPHRSMKTGLRNPPGYGATQRKPLKAVLPAFDALRTVLPVTCHGSSPQFYRASRSVPLPDMRLSPS